MKTQYIIALCGKKQSGKDTLARYAIEKRDVLIPHIQTVHKYGFADKLKEFCEFYLGVPHEALWGTDEEKNEQTSLLWEDMPHYDTLRIQHHTGELETLPSGHMTGREVMQQVGTEWFRKIRPNIWIDLLLEQIQKDNADLAFICDMRFPNEVGAIRSEGGYVVRLTRAVSDSKHISETALDGFHKSNFDYVIDNHEMSLEASQEAFASFVKEITGGYE